MSRAPGDGSVELCCSDRHKAGVSQFLLNTCSIEPIGLRVFKKAPNDRVDDDGTEHLLGVEYEEEGWNKREKGHVEIVDVSYLFEDLPTKRIRVGRILDSVDSADLELRCLRLVGEAGECSTLRQWIEQKRLNDGEVAR